uniref:Amidase domain-containing protein n=1 Tax=Macrostomum lignano TaxID=282301 RepID=A0A1I8JM37_9PLAT
MAWRSSGSSHEQLISRASKKWHPPFAQLLKPRCVESIEQILSYPAQKAYEDSPQALAMGLGYSMLAPLRLFNRVAWLSWLQSLAEKLSASIILNLWYDNQLKICENLRLRRVALTTALSPWLRVDGRLGYPEAGPTMRFTSVQRPIRFHRRIGEARESDGVIYVPLIGTKVS